MGNAQHQGWQPQPFDWRPVALFYAFVGLLLTASLCPRRCRRLCRTPAPCCSRSWHPPWAILSRGEAGVLLMFIVCVGLCFAIAWSNMVDDEDDAPFLTSSLYIKVALITRCIGHMNEAQIGLAMLPVTRNSVWLHGLALPFEHALKYHRALGRMAIGFMTLHMALWWAVWIGEGVWLPNAVLQTGYVAQSQGLEDPTIVVIECTWLLAVSLAALQFVRRANFELFVYSHYLMLVVVGLVAFHSWFAGGYLVYILVGPVALYGLDRCGRARRSRFVLRVTRLEAMKGATIVEYDIPTDLAARVYPGQYSFLNIPAISGYQWHPVSFSRVQRVRSDGDGRSASMFVTRVTHHIKDMGPETWSGDLHRLAEGCVDVKHLSLSREDTYMSIRDVRRHERRHGMVVRSDGPYGVPFGGVDLSTTDSLVLVAGGIGATPIMSVLSALLDGEVRVSTLQAVEILWVVRHPSQVDWFEDVVEELHRRSQRSTGGDTDSQIQFHLTVHATCTAQARSAPEGSVALSSSMAPPSRGHSQSSVRLRPMSSFASSNTGSSNEDSRILAAERGYATCRPSLPRYFASVASRRVSRSRLSGRLSSLRHPPSHGNHSAIGEVGKPHHVDDHSDHKTVVTVWTCGPQSLMDDVHAAAPKAFGSECEVVSSEFRL